MVGDLVGLPMPAGVEVPWHVEDHARKVIYSDFVGIDGWSNNVDMILGSVRAPHQREGFNRLFGDGSVTWANYGPVTSTINASPAAALQQAAFYEEMDRLP